MDKAKSIIDTLAIINFLLSLGATFLGVILAFLLNSYLSKKSEEKSIQRSFADNLKRKQFVLKSLIEDVKINSQILKDIKDELCKEFPLLDFSINIKTWQTLGHEAFQIFRNAETVQSVAFYYQNLENLGQSLSLYLPLTLQLDVSTLDFRNRLLKRLANRASVGISLIGQVMRLIETEISMLRDDK